MISKKASKIKDFFKKYLFFLIKEVPETKKWRAFGKRKRPKEDAKNHENDNNIIGRNSYFFEFAQYWHCAKVHKIHKTKVFKTNKMWILPKKF